MAAEQKRQRFSTPPGEKRKSKEEPQLPTVLISSHYVVTQLPASVECELDEAPMLPEESDGPIIRGSTIQIRAATAVPAFRCTKDRGIQYPPQVTLDLVEQAIAKLRATGNKTDAEFADSLTRTEQTLQEIVATDNTLPPLDHWKETFLRKGSE